MLEKIKESLNRLAPMKEEDWCFFASRLQKKVVPSKQLLIKKNTIEQHLSFLEEGVVRYFIPKEENDLTFSFAFESEFCSAYDSFLTQKPCYYQIETLTTSTLWQLSYIDLQEIYQETKIGQEIGRRAAEELFLKKFKREMILLHQSAEERYLALFEESPKLILQIPLKYIATYIGVTPQALSRIRKRIS
ncbi:MAG: Crp/Fnr family transcriptional regulator [Aureispira sp.]